MLSLTSPFSRPIRWNGQPFYLVRHEYRGAQTFFILNSSAGTFDYVTDTPNRNFSRIVGGDVFILDGDAADTVLLWNETQNISYYLALPDVFFFSGTTTLMEGGIGFGVTSKYIIIGWLSDDTADYGDTIRVRVFDKETKALLWDYTLDTATETGYAHGGTDQLRIVASETHFAICYSGYAGADNLVHVQVREIETGTRTAIVWNKTYSNYYSTPGGQFQSVALTSDRVYALGVAFDLQGNQKGSSPAGVHEHGEDTALWDTLAQRFSASETQIAIVESSYDYLTSFGGDAVATVTVWDVTKGGEGVDDAYALAGSYDFSDFTDPSQEYAQMQA